MLREIWKRDELLGRSNKRKLEIRRPRRKQAQEWEVEKDASGHWGWAERTNTVMIGICVSQ